MNIKSQQLKSELSLCIDYDQPLQKNEMTNKLLEILGNSNCSIETVNGSKVLIYKTNNGNHVLLYKAITYLGNPHPIFKKRIQLPMKWKDICIYYSTKHNYDVSFIGIYHYDNHIIFADFNKTNYLKNDMNNSAAHVYINDLYQGVKNSFFSKLDRNGNIISTIHINQFKSYLDNKTNFYNRIPTKPFETFNGTFNFDKWLYAKDVIPEMHQNNWINWKQAEWPGWYLEYRFDQYIQHNNLENIVKYIGSSPSTSGYYDLDLWFDLNHFYGDLKASDENTLQSPGNDKTTFLQAINEFDRFWYVIYEHKTHKDSFMNYEATKFRNQYINDNSNGMQNDSMSYHKRMKHSVLFTKMMIIELNRINYGDVLSEFNQGRQPSGALRNPKFRINKRDIDNYVIYRYDSNNVNG